MSELLKSLYEKTKSAKNAIDQSISGAKRKFTDALVEATDLTPADMKKGDLYEQQKQERKDVTGNLFDLATPDASMAIGKLSKLGKLGQLMNRPDMVNNIVSQASKAASKGKDVYGKVIQMGNTQQQPGYGKVTVMDNSPKQVGFGKVTVLDNTTKQAGFGSVTVKDMAPTSNYGKINFKPY